MDLRCLIRGIMLSSCPEMARSRYMLFSPSSFIGWKLLLPPRRLIFSRHLRIPPLPPSSHLVPFTQYCHPLPSPPAKSAHNFPHQKPAAPGALSPSRRNASRISFIRPRSDPPGTEGRIVFDSAREVGRDSSLRSGLRAKQEVRSVTVNRGTGKPKRWEKVANVKDGQG